MLGTLSGDTLSYGQGKAYRDGSLGCIGCGAVSLPGAYRDGSLGMAVGPGAAYRSGSLGLGISLGGNFVWGLLLAGSVTYLLKRPPKFLKRS
jgi:hypothetical protein